jgi:hypothetical protein
VERAHKPALVFRWLEHERLVIVYQGSQVPSAAEWQAYLEQLRSIADIEHRALVYSEHHISRKEQEEIKQATHGSAKPRIALISPSTAVRFVASVFTLLNRNLRFFAPSHFDQALAHLACDEREVEVVTQSYQQLRAQVVS